MIARKAEYRIQEDATAIIKREADDRICREAEDGIIQKVGNIVWTDTDDRIAWQAYTRILLVADEKGTGFDLGTPMTKSKIEGTVKETKKGKKIMVVKYKAKIRYKKNTGHRQFASTVEVGKF